MLSVDLSDNSHIKGNIAIIKHTDDGETKIETPESGATFEIYLKSAGSYTASEEDERDIIVCDENGFGQTKDMPYGVYTVHQTSGWEGREMMKDFDVFIAQNGQTYRYLINNANFESYIKVVKVDAESGKTIPYAGAGFQIYDPTGNLVTMSFTYIEARYTDASASTLTFTHETWDYVYKEQGAKYPDKKIVGWQHTHPSYGIFLSNYDLFIQENFFNLPFQVAYVIDPIQKIRGFFQWKNGKIEKLKGYYIYDDVGKSIKIEPERETTRKQPTHQSGKALPILSALAILIAGISLVSMFNMRSSLIEQNRKLEDSIQTQQQEIDAIGQGQLCDNQD